MCWSHIHISTGCSGGLRKFSEVKVFYKSATTRRVRWLVLRLKSSSTYCKWVLSRKKVHFSHDIGIIFFSFYSYHFIIKLVLPPCGQGSTTNTVWWISHTLEVATTFACVLLEHGGQTNPFFRLPHFYWISGLQKKKSTLKSSNIFPTPSTYEFF